MSGIIAQNTLDNSGLIKAPAGGGAWNFIKKLTASGDSDLSFVDGADDVDLSTYKEYVFTFNNIHPETDGSFISFNASDDDSSHSYDVVKTTTLFRAYHFENGSGAVLAYEVSKELAESTDFQFLIAEEIDNGNDSSASGYLHLFNPSSEVFVKHFMSRMNSNGGTFTTDSHLAGYFNTTADITAIQFKMDQDAIDAGDICLYGLTT